MLTQLRVLVYGRGAGNQLPKDGMFLNIKEFNKHLESQNIHPGSEKATKLLQEAMTKNPEMDLSLS